jgi:hypothetical protein
MSAPGTRTIIWAGGEDQFCLTIGQILDLEIVCRAGIAIIANRLSGGEWGLSDLRETIRLGLIGGGMDPERAMSKVRNFVDTNPHGLAHSVLVAHEIICSALFGAPKDDPVGKTKPAGAMDTGSSTTTDASDAPRS